GSRTAFPSGHWPASCAIFADQEHAVGGRFDRPQKPLLCPSALQLLPQQGNDQQRLDEAQDDAAEDMPPVQLPDRRLSVADDATRWQTRLVQLEATELTPVD